MRVIGGIRNGILQKLKHAPEKILFLYRACMSKSLVEAAHDVERHLYVYIVLQLPPHTAYRATKFGMMIPPTLWKWGTLRVKRRTSPSPEVEQIFYSHYVIHRQLYLWHYAILRCMLETTTTICANCLMQRRQICDETRRTRAILAIDHSPPTEMGLQLTVEL